MNRRHFLRNTSLATLALSGTELSFSQKETAPGRGPHKIYAFEKPLHFLDNAALANLIAGLGFSGIEATVRPGGRVPPERVEEDLPRLVEALQKRGLEIGVMASGINRVNDLNEKVLRTAAKLGIRHYRLAYWHYDFKKPILPQLDAIAPALKDLAALNRELGLTGVYQNHAGSNYVGAVLWDLYSLIKDLNPAEIGLAFDIRHAVLENGLSWPAQFHLAKSHIRSVYVKDFAWENRKPKNVPLGQGQVDAKFFPMLKEAGFSGPISLHVEYLDHVKDAKLLGDAFGRDLKTLQAWL